MSNNLRFRSYTGGYPDAFPPGVKGLLIVNTAIFFLQSIARMLGHDRWIDELMLSAHGVLHLEVWQLVTYMFLHAGFMHIFFNMLALYWFGPDLERTWGTRRFLNYYFVCGVGAGICVVIANLILHSDSATLGASGALFGMFMAYGLLFPERQILFFFVIPMKVKHLVWILGLIELYFCIRPESGGVSNVAHLGGLLVGYLYLKSKYTNFDVGRGIADWYHQWKLQRAKKKFQVYMRKHGGPGGTIIQ